VYQHRKTPPFKRALPHITKEQVERGNDHRTLNHRQVV
jgi:hypothetical protein